MTGPTYRRSAELLEAGVDDGMVALDPQSGLCFGFNDVAADIWHLLDRPCSFDEIRDALMEEYEVSQEECGRDLQQVIAAMAEAGLVASD